MNSDVEALKQSKILFSQRPMLMLLLQPIEYAENS